MEDPVHAVFVVGGGEDVGNNELAATGDDDGVVAEVGVLEEDAGIFLMDADGVFDDLSGACTVHELCVHIVDAALAVASEAERVGHVATAVLA